MTQLEFIDLLQQSVWLMVLLSAPILIVSMVVGVGISIFQAVTQIQESTLTFVPKILVSFAVLLLTAPWMVDTLLTHTARLFDSLVKYAR